jgi:acid phosphatase
MRGLLSRSILIGLMGAGLLAAPAAASGHRGHHDGGLGKIRHFVVVYEENHSFDNLYGGWERVDGLRRADPGHTRQVDQGGARYACLLQDDVNLTSPPLPADCDSKSHFPNAPFTIDDYIAPEDKTCPAPGVFATNGVLKDSPGALPGGCTRDLVHRFYQEQYQLDGGKQDRYVTGSDAEGLTMGTYDTRKLPIYDYLHGRGHPDYAISDRFFQAAFGGSFLNHQWLVAAATPTFSGAATSGPDDLHSKVDANGMPIAYPPLYTTDPAAVKDAALTIPCGSPNAGSLACGDYAVNTIQPPYQPYSPGTPDARRLPPQKGATIGDRLSERGIDWAWYSGGWSNADGDIGAPGWTNSDTACTDPDTAANATFPNCPNKLFQYHHQPFNYYASFAPDTAARRQHLRDEDEFETLASASRRHCRIKPVSIIKPIGSENEHPGYASEHTGSDHLVDLLQQVQGSACARDTMVIVTYDEFGGQWDHVPPPGQGTRTPGPHDQMGPSTRIPALTLAPGLRRRFSVDHASHDTTSIAATIEHRFGLRPLSSRDAHVQDLSTVFARRGGRH